MSLTRIMLGAARGGLCLAWLPFALSLALVALVLSWILRPARIDGAGDGLASAVMASVALLLLASTVPVRTDRGPVRAGQASSRPHFSMAA